MKRKVLMQLVVPLLGLCVLFVLLAFEPDASRRAAEPSQISVILRETDTSCFAAARQGMEQAAADLGAELRILTLGTANDAAEQRELLRREADGGADAVVLVPADRESLAADVKKITGELPVVTMETDLTKSGARVWVGADNEALGRALGQAALNGAEPGRTVLALSSVPGDNGVQDRLESAAAVLAEAGRDVRVCAARDGQSVGQALAEELSAVSPALVLAFEASALEQAAQVMDTRAEPPLLYGVGATNSIAAGLEQGRITAIAAQNEFTAGYLAVESAARQAKKLAAEPVEPLGFSILRRENMYEPDHQKLLFPVTR